MLDKLKSIFNTLLSDTGPLTLELDKKKQPVDDDGVIAILVLLIEMSAADDHIDEEETEVIINIIESHFPMSHEYMKKLFERAIEERSKVDKIDKFVSLVNELYSERQKTLVLSLVWRVVFADDKVEDFERKFAVQMKYRLQLSDEAAEKARAMAEQSF